MAESSGVNLCSGSGELRALVESQRLRRNTKPSVAIAPVWTFVMSLADHHDIASHGEAPFDIARGNLAPALCRLLGAVPFAAMLAATVVPGSAFAQCATPDTVLCAKQTADQARCCRRSTC